MVWVIMGLTFIVVFHELGHFIFAKIFGVTVERFSIGFGPILLSKKFRGTEYALSLIPLGGYVKMYGENGKSGKVADTPVPPERSFTNKPPWQRMTIALAGPAFNLILGGVLIILVFAFYDNYMLTNKVGSVEEKSPAQTAGIAPGDKITNINGKKIKDWTGLTDALSSQSADKPIELTVERKGQQLKIKTAPETIEATNEFGEKVKRRTIGVGAAEPVLVKKLTEKAEGAITISKQMIKIIVLSFVKLFQGKIPVKQLVGPVKMVKMGSEITNQDGTRGALLFLALVSFNLGIINLLPLPILDGGHIPFLIIEWVRKKPVSQKVQGIALTVGFILIIGLFLFVIFNDLDLLP